MKMRQQWHQVRRFKGRWKAREVQARCRTEPSFSRKQPCRTAFWSYTKHGLRCQLHCGSVHFGGVLSLLSFSVLFCHMKLSCEPLRS